MGIDFDALKRKLDKLSGIVQTYASSLIASIARLYDVKYSFKGRVAQRESTTLTS